MPFIVDRNMRKSLVSALEKFDNTIYFSNDCKNVYFPVNTHPDLQIHFVNKSVAYTPPELFKYYRNILPQNIQLHKGNKNLGGTYPLNVAYNISRIGNNVILNKKYADEKIIEYYESENFDIINVNQGYTKCNICSDGEVVLTEDDGIFKVLNKSNIKTMRIKPGQVKLQGFDYGFIGGASGVFGNKILFCGKFVDKGIEEKVIDFFYENQKEVIFLDNEPLTDYGSIIYFE